MKMLDLRSILTIAVLLCGTVFFTASEASAVGKKYGIFVGINDYPGDDNDLTGAVNDANGLRKLLISKYRFLPANTTLLLDSKATRAGILGKIRAYGALVGPGDILVFQYSGHGTLFRDIFSDVLDETKKTEVDIELENGERYQLPPDFYDSAIVPWDSDSRASGKAWGGMILDDELYELFSGITGKGATVVFISDSCHSGTVGKGEAGRRKARFMTPESALNVKSLEELNFKTPAKQTKVADRTFDNKYIALTASRDDEVAWDGNNSAVPGGLFTSTLIDVINASRAPLTYRRLLAIVLPRVAVSNQHPQLDQRFGNVDTRLFEPVAAR